MQLIIKLIAMDKLQNKFTGIGFTYDDVLLVPSYSEFLPNQVDLTTKFSKNINLNNTHLVKCHLFNNNLN